MKIGVVLVTFNRLDKLKTALNAYDSQKKLPEYVIVVNNCSTDGTDKFLDEWKKENTGYERIVINLNKNTGGAGGFHAGLERSMELGADWVYVADDDAYPMEDAFAELESVYESDIAPTGDKIAAVASAVINGGEIHYQHRNHLNVSRLKVKFRKSDDHDYSQRTFDFDVFSYVGTAMNKAALKEYGLTIKDYFIYCDDQEHSLRLKQYGRIVCIPSSKIIHDTPGFSEKAFFWGDYYHIRNDIITRRKYFPLQGTLRMIKGYYTKVIKDKSASAEQKKLIKTAYSDALHKRIGIHSTYKPGWTLKK